MANKEKRIEMLIKKNISDILLFELHDKEVGFVTVTDIKMSKDYQYARVFVSFLGTKNPAKNLDALKKARGFVRTSLSKKMDIWKIPQIEFVLDDTFEKADKINKVLKRESDELEELKRLREQNENSEK
jgi:ribosome-binding factor A